MARLKHVTTGAVVNVTDEKAARMGSEWAPVREQQAEPAPTRRRKKPAAK